MNKSVFNLSGKTEKQNSVVRVGAFGSLENYEREVADTVEVLGKNSYKVVLNLDKDGNAKLNEREKCIFSVLMKIASEQKKPIPIDAVYLGKVLSNRIAEIFGDSVVLGSFGSEIKNTEVLKVIAFCHQIGIDFSYLEKNFRWSIKFGSWNENIKVEIHTYADTQYRKQVAEEKREEIASMVFELGISFKEATKRYNEAHKNRGLYEIGFSTEE